MPYTWSIPRAGRRYTATVPKRYYITTPIYYVNSVPHVGHALTMFVCDATRRYRRMRGDDAYFLTGTDENGTKVLEAAQSAGKDPGQFVDEISEQFRSAWKVMNFEYDDFIRTTESRHRRAVQELFGRLRERDAIYLDKYEGWYDVGSEAFVKESDIVDGKSPDGNEVRWVSEENWFFRLSDYTEPLLQHIRSNADFLLPETRKNEAVAFIESGLRDMCITRHNPGWGVPVPGDETKVVYVWFDALISYLAATGWPDPGWENTWPADVHWMAKEIFTRFHATLWPAMLMAADLPLPKTVIAHGWFTFGDDKMSKSKGNVVAPTDLIATIESLSGCSRAVAVDAVRYSLGAFLPYEGDTSYTQEGVIARYNSDLANDLGNALNRTLAMAHKFVAGKAPGGDIEPDMAAAIAQAREAVAECMETHRLDRALDRAWELVRFLNKYIDTRAPWSLAKSGDAALGSVMRSTLLGLRAVEGVIRPFLPATADAIAAQLGVPPLQDWEKIGRESSLPEGVSLQQPQPIFPRIVASESAEPMNPPSPKPAPRAEAGAVNPSPEITIEDFAKARLRVARILEAEPIEGSAKLLKLQVLIGDEKRQVIAGIAKSYAPLDLIGRQVVVVTNLKPATLMGHQSQGMILAADGPDGGAILLTPESEAPEGASVH